jgi:carbon monoxide dehydrogenase subunit G
VKLEDTCVLPARPDVVWAALNDPAVLSAALPGCKSLAMIDESHFESTIQVRVGPVAATFRGEVELADLEPPRAYTIIGRGNAGAVGFATMTARVQLEEEGDKTLLRYNADVEIGGKLMSVGARLIQSVAAKNVESFFSAFAKQLEEKAAVTANAAEAAEQPVVAAQPAMDDSPAAQGAPNVVSTQASAMPAQTLHLDASNTHVASGILARQTDAPVVVSVRLSRMLWAVGVAAGASGVVIGFLAAHVV